MQLLESVPDTESESAQSTASSSWILTGICIKLVTTSRADALLRMENSVCYRQPPWRGCSRRNRSTVQQVCLGDASTALGGQREDGPGQLLTKGGSYSHPSFPSHLSWPLLDYDELSPGNKTHRCQFRVTDGRPRKEKVTYPRP